jgi:hypothetical protein
MIRWMFALPAFLLLAGCGGDESTRPVVPANGLPAGTPAADSPAHLMQRFEATWDSQAGAQYALLLTEDFRFHFSETWDFDLVDAYGDTWDKASEDTAASNLFDGFRLADGTFVPGAKTVDLFRTEAIYEPDPAHPDSTAHYQRVRLEMGLDAEFAGKGATPLLVHSDSQAVYLVRGDAAVLAPGATPDTAAWYVRRWDDRSASFSSPSHVESIPTTIGRVKWYFTPSTYAIATR